jgi:hypothetical protein
MDRMKDISNHIREIGLNSYPLETLKNMEQQLQNKRDKDK